MVLKKLVSFLGGDSISGYFDIHNHILPGLDDGASNIEETKNMLHVAYKEGIRHIIATPHFREDRFPTSKQDVNLAYEKTKEIILQEGLDISLYLGNEVYFSHNVSELLVNNGIFTLAGSDYVLVEFSPSSSYQYIKSALQTLIINGFFPILAHFERYNNIINNWDYIDEFYNMGVYFQVNASTVIGSIIKKPTRFVRKLIKYDMVDFIATDAHNDNSGYSSRTPTISTCVSYLQKNYGQDLVYRLLHLNPSKIITNEEV